MTEIVLSGIGVTGGGIGVTGAGIGLTGAWTGSGVDGTIPVKKSLRGFASIGLAVKGVTGVGIGVTGAWTGSGVDGTILVKKSLRGFASIGLAVKGITGVGIGVTGAGIGVTGVLAGAGVRRDFSTTGFGVTGFFPTVLTCMHNVRIDPPFQKLK